MIDVYRDEITAAVNEMTKANVPIYHNLLKAARIKAYDLKGSQSEPASILYPDVTYYTNLDETPEVFYYITSEVSCKCGDRLLAFRFPMNHMCPQGGKLFVDPRQIYALWRLLDLLGLQEDSDEDELNKSGECFDCEKCHVEGKMQKRMGWYRAVSTLIVLLSRFKANVDLSSA